MVGEEYLAGMGLGAGIIAFIGAFLIAILILMIIVYIILSISLMKIANKTKTKNAWLAWIPIANIFLMVFIAKKEWWWALIIILVGIVPIIGGIVSMVLFIYIWWLITERLKKPGPLALLWLIPVVNLGYVLYLAFSD